MLNHSPRPKYVSTLLACALLLAQLAPLDAQQKAKVKPAPAPPTTQAAQQPRKGGATTDAEKHVTLPAPIATVLNAPSVTATKDDGRTSAQGAISGDAINYTVTITNTGTADATGVTFNDTPDANTTLVASSVHASPVALDDSYNWIGNTVLDTAARSLPAITSNDSAPTDSFTLSTTPAVNPSHGSVTINAGGSFVYTPNAGYTGDDTFAYTLTNTADNTLSATGTVTIHMPVRVWYVQNALSNGDGRSNSPFNSPSAASAAASASTDIIYVFSDIGANAKLNGNFSLDNGQQFLGQGVALVVNSGGNNVTLFPSGTAPTTTNSSGNGVTLATGASNTISGINIGNCSGSGIASTTNFGTLTVSGVSINTTGQALNLGSGTVAGAGFTSVTSSGGTNNVSLTSVNGTVVLGGGGLSGASGTSFVSTGSNNATITYSGTISKTSAGKVVDIQNHTGNTITLGGNLTCNSGCTGVNVSNNTGGAVDFSGGTKTITTSGANNAVTLTGNAGATVSFSNGGLAITASGTGEGLVATGGGTVNVTTGASDNTISTADTAASCASGNCSAALDAGGVALGMTFKSVSVNGSNGHTPVGIRLDTTTGSLTVTGDGSGKANGSGGTISNVTSRGVNATGAAGAYTFKSMGFTLNSAALAGMFFDNSAFSGTPTVNATGCTFLGANSASQADALAHFQMDQATGEVVNFQNCYFNSSHNYGFFATASGSGTATVTVNQSGFGTDVSTTTTGTNQPGTTMQNANAIYMAITNGGNAQVHYNVTNNTFWGASGAAGAIYGVTISGGNTNASSVLSGTISGNKLGKTGVTGSGCASSCGGVGLLPGTAGTYNVTFSNNDIRQTNSLAVNLQNTVSGSTISGIGHFTNNTIAEPDTTGSPSFQRALVVSTGNSTSPSSGNWCAQITGNTISGGWQAGNWIRITTLNANGTLTLPGLSPTTGATAAQVNAFLQSQNTFTGGTGSDVNTTIGGAINGGSPCTATPPLAPASAAAAHATHLLTPSQQDDHASLAHDNVPHKITARQSITAQPITARGAKPSTPVVSATQTGVSVSVGTLQPGKSVTIKFSVTVNNGLPNSVTSVSNQGTVSGTNFTTVNGKSTSQPNTNDTENPGPAGSPNPTVTTITPPPVISAHDAKAIEPASGTAPMPFTVTLSHAYPQAVAVSYQTADTGGASGGNCGDAGVDYQTSSGTLTFAAGEVVKVASVPVCADSADNTDADETFQLQLSSPSSNASLGTSTATGTITETNAPGAVLISELRTSGPAGADDGFVELYNNSNSPADISGWSIVQMGSTCADSPVVLATLPGSAGSSATVVPARGHYLVAGSAYSLASYAAADLTLPNTAHIAQDGNLALFNTSSLASLSTATRIDAVGFSANAGGTCDLLREGATLAAASGSASQYGFFRKLTTGTPQDTNDNASDFMLVSTTPSVAVGTTPTPTLGAPGPENKTSPVNRGSQIKATLLDPAASSSSTPNRDRDTTAGSCGTSTPAGNCAAGTLVIRRTFTNNTGGTVSKLRFRVVDVTTAPSPGGGVADVRLLGSTAATVGGKPVVAMTLETPPAQGSGGGYNSSIAATLPGGSLAPGGSVSVQFTLGVQTPGSFRFFVIVEALP